MFYNCATLLVPGMEVFELKNWGEMSVMDTIFSRWELAVADNVYIRNRSRITMSVQNYNTFYASFVDVFFWGGVKNKIFSLKRPERCECDYIILFAFRRLLNLD